MQNSRWWWEMEKTRSNTNVYLFIVSSLLLKVTHYLEHDFPPTLDMEVHVVRSYAQYSHCTVFLLAKWRC